MTLEEREKRNKKVGWLVSIAVQFLLLLIFYFLIAWRTPFPPIPAYGIELGFESVVGTEANAMTSKTQIYDVLDEEMNQAEQETVSETNNENSLMSDESIEVESNMKSEILKPEVEVSPLIEETEPINSSEKVEISEPEIDNRALMKSAIDSDLENSSENIEQEQSEAQKVDHRAIYNNGEKMGAEDRVRLSLAGWVWERPPNPNDDSTESGKIVFNIVVNSEGYIASCSVASSNITPAVVKKYQDAVLSLSFRPTMGTIARTSSGQITFVIKSK